MQRTELAGLVILLAGVDEVLSASGGSAARGDPPGLGPADLAETDLIRVEAPDVTAWAALRACGFLPKPDRVTWIADSGPDDAAFLARMGRRERASIRNARRWVGDQGGTVVASHVTEPSLSEFLALYDEQLTRMPRGFPAAHGHRDDLLARSAEMTMLQVRIDGRLVGSCIAECRSGTGLARIRFSAVAEDGRAHGLAGALYTETVTLMRERGIKRVTLGNDPNIYGHLVQPGLFEYKRHLGFVPVASRTVDASDGIEVADRLVSLRHLHDPTLMIGLAENAEVREGQDAALTLDYFCAGDEPPAVPKHLPATISRARVHRVAGADELGACTIPLS